mgnify:FL=1
MIEMLTYKGIVGTKYLNLNDQHGQDVDCMQVLHIQKCTHAYTSTFMQKIGIYMQIDEILETYLKDTNGMRGNKRLTRRGVINEMKVDYEERDSTNR